MSTDAIIHLLHTETGIDASITGERSYVYAIKNRMQSLNISDQREYLELLHQSADEMGQLVDDIVVPETWFFRDQHAFDALVTALNSSSRVNPFPRRILSVPSSSGEEAYSIAIKLFESGYTAEMFSIDAIDISQRNINAARRGLYRQHSFRNHLPDHIMQKYFISDRDGYEVCDKVKQAVNFSRASLFDSEALNSKQQYDAIFCRNLLIYFNSRQKSTAIEKLDAALKDKGILLIGHSESAIIPSGAYTPCTTVRSFGFIKTGRQAATKKPAITKRNIKTVSANAGKITPPRNRPTQASNRKRAEAETDTRSTTNKAPINSSLRQAKQLADSGRLDEALTLILSDGDSMQSAQRYTLLGTIYGAMNNSIEAERSFRKALFLEPDDYDALVQLAFLLQSKGDSKNAQLLNKRAAKSRNRDMDKELAT